MNRLTRLTEAERAVLRLLGQGHDTKSSATTLGISTHAVNERLREARRKLEVTSSREAARVLLAAEGGVQEIRDRFSGDAAGPVGAASLVAPVLSRRVLTGVFAVTVLALAAFAWTLAAPAAAPKVVATSPASGAQVTAGPAQVSVTFDQPMQPGSFSFVQTDPARFPSCARVPRQSKDERTFALQCQLLPGREYEVWFNRGRWLNFKSKRGVPAEPYRLVFRTAP